MTPEPYPEIRAAVAKLCAKVPGDDWPKLDRDMPCPQAFVDALTSTSWLAVLAGRADPRRPRLRAPAAVSRRSGAKGNAARGLQSRCPSRALDIERKFRETRL